MRELDRNELLMVSGGWGAINDGRRENPNPFGEPLPEGDQGQWPISNPWIPVFGEGESQPGGYDPSPEDGVDGLKIDQNEDGSFDWQTEQRGFFDLNGNGIMDAGEGPYNQGESGTTTNGWGSDWGQAKSVLSSYTALPGIGV